MRSHETFEELAAVYAVGGLDGDDLVGSRRTWPRAAIGARASLRESGEALALVALAGTRVVPPARVKAALLARVAAAGARPRRAPEPRELGAMGRGHRRPRPPSRRC